MSEFKYACPVCGQHMVCDTSQSGSVMECPTCFQKIVAPQVSTTSDPKFILTGTKYSDKKITETVARNAMARNAATGVTPQKSAAPVIVALVMVLLIAGGATVFILRSHLSGSSSPAQTPTNSNSPANPAAPSSAQNQPPAKKPAKPPAVAPPSSDTNWVLTLDAVTNFPATPVAGRIHGQDFIMERAYFQNGILTLRNGTRGPVEFGCNINFGGAEPEALAGKSINVMTNADTAARVTLRWKNDTGSGKVNYDSGYAMLLEFGPLDKGHLPGKIYLCTPDDEKSYLMGTFNADARKPKPKKQ